MHTPSSFKHTDGDLHSITQHVVLRATPHYIRFVACRLIGELCSSVLATGGLRRAGTMSELASDLNELLSAHNVATVQSVAVPQSSLLQCTDISPPPVGGQR